MMSINLSRFVDPGRPGLDKPWSHRIWTYATDGHIGVRVERRPNVTNENGPNFQEIMDAREEARDLQPMPSFRVPAYLPDTVPVEIAPGLYIQARYAKLIAGLPGALIDLGVMRDQGAVRFVFDGGEGMVMPYTPTGHQAIVQPDEMERRAG